MKITTETGSVYTIERGICTKENGEGSRLSAFKVFSIKSVPSTVTTWDQIVALPKGEPEVGKRLYIAGMDDDWLSTVIVSIEGELD